MKYQKNPLLEGGFVNKVVGGLVTGNPAAAFLPSKQKLLNKIAKPLVPKKLRPVMNPVGTAIAKA